MSAAQNGDQASLIREGTVPTAITGSVRSSIESDGESHVERLIQAIEVQGNQIGELGTHVGLLVQAVARLLGEEAGTPVQEEGTEPARVDLDGNPY